MPNVNSKPETEHVTNLAMLARLHGLEESNLMNLVFEFGEEEGSYARDRRINCSTGSTLRLRVLRRRSRGKERCFRSTYRFLDSQPKRKKSAFLFRGSGGLGMQTSVWRFLFGGNGIWVCKGKAWEGDVDGYFTTLGGRILDPERELSGLGLVGLQEVVFNGRLRCGAIRSTGKAVEVPNIGEWQWCILWCFSLLEHSLVVLSVWDPSNWQSGRSWGFCWWSGRGNGVQVGVVGSEVWWGWGLHWAGVGWGLLWEEYVGSAQLVVIRRMFLKVSPLSRRSGGAQGRERNVGVPGAGVGRVRFEEGVQGGGVGEGWFGGCGGAVASW